MSELAFTVTGDTFEVPNGDRVESSAVEAA